MGKRKNLIIALSFAVLLIAVIAGAAALQSLLLSGTDDLLPNGSDDPLVGQQAPTFYFSDADGHTFSLHDFYGTPIVLNFWASWCPPCQIEKPHFQQAFEQYGDQAKFIMINVSENPDVVQAYLKENNYSFPVYFDEIDDAARALDVVNIPTTVFIDAEGVITAKFLGAMSFETIERSITSLLGR
ncbi:MAG: TlpA family protein disulfide reductase [Coriobacteriia bacterium]|nr:TlpA family protein disulfide reductase [Coriobacteriia bacterium]